MFAVKKTASRYGAYPDEWQTAQEIFGAENLLPSLHNPNAELSPNSTIGSVARLAKIPSHYNEAGQAAGFPKWTNHRATPEQVLAWANQPDYGISLITGRGFIAVDCDTENPDEIATVREILKQHCGVVPPCRYRENSNRRTFVIAVLGEHPKQVITLRAKGEDVKAEAIEFLGTGQQTLIAGSHTSGARLQWEGGRICTPPNLSAEQFKMLVADIASAFPDAKTTANKVRDASVIYTPWATIADALLGDPVASWLNENGWIVGNDGKTKFFIRCPHEEHHSDGGSASSTAYTSDRNPRLCSFKCQHTNEHCLTLKTPWDWAEALAMPVHLRAAYEIRSAANADDFEDLTVTPDDADAVHVAPPEREANLLDWRSVDILNPPGITGTICSEINRLSNRALPLAAVPAAFHALALAAGKGKKRGLSGEKFSLCTFTIATTAAGKEAAQAYIKKVASRAGLAKHLSNKPRSDKDLIMNIFESAAVTMSSIDEAHAYLDSVNNKQSSEHKQALGGLMLEILTSQLFTLSGLHAREITAHLDNQEKAMSTQDAKERKQLKRGELDEIEYQCNANLRAQRIGEIGVKRDWIRNGIPSPVANFMLSSTPEKLESAINNADICSGLIGRSLIFANENIRVAQQAYPEDMPRFDETAPLTKYIVKTLRQIASPVENHQTTATPEARAALHAVFHYFENDEKLNTPIIGGLYARAVERVYSLAALLALESGVVEVEHVNYAVAVFMHSVETSRALARQNAASGITEIIQLEILAQLSSGAKPHRRLVIDVGRKAAIVPAVKRADDMHEPNPVEVVLAALIKRGTIEETGRKGGRYRLANTV